MNQVFALILFFLSLASLNFIPEAHARDDQIGGKYHQQALEAWKEYKHGKDIPESELMNFLMTGKESEKAKYHEIACRRGVAGFCMLGGMKLEKISEKRAAELYNHGCDIDHDNNNCMLAVYAYLLSGQLKRADAIYVVTCNEDSLACNMLPGAKVYSKFVAMLKRTCSAGHQSSCDILKTNADDSQKKK